MAINGIHKLIDNPYLSTAIMELLPVSTLEIDAYFNVCEQYEGMKNWIQCFCDDSSDKDQSQTDA